ncbi:hypothetical protein AsAng_0004690 [Aureispira anguillae]|uniref:Uncharacterized protein n=1 Tax=Aureispira anguillae TaxID=2864201 RepID=A0A915YB11_9BACT|nr:hypothetical protein AsAng_0004690 [Aureispira anguillae]
MDSLSIVPKVVRIYMVGVKKEGQIIKYTLKSFHELKGSAN